MSREADLMIDLLAGKRSTGADLTIEKTAHALALLSFSSTEIGWVLRHLFGLTMPDAVHRATVVIDSCRGENGGR